MTRLSREFLRSPEGRAFQGEVRDALKRDIEQLAARLFGPPKRRSGREMRFPGTIDVVVKGPKRGLWTCRSGDAGGDAIAMIQFAGRLADAGTFIPMVDPTAGT
jgi:hypothetical protein